MDFTKNEHPLVCDALTELPINENQDEAE